MKTSSAVGRVAGTLFGGILLIAQAAQAQNDVSFQGRVTAVEGQRLQVLLDNGTKVWMTTTSPLRKGLVGQMASGRYKVAGDTLFVESPAFGLKPR